MARTLKRYFWRLRLRYLESRIKEPFNLRLSLAIDRATVRVEELSDDLQTE
jgi:hypothetical protein